MTLHNVCLLWILAIVCADFAIEPQYDTLNHFGPTNNSNWAARPMTRVAPFTVSIGPLNVLANQEFMFVSLIPDGALIPPLGKMKWKNSKIGTSCLRIHMHAVVSTIKLIICLFGFYVYRSVQG